MLILLLALATPADQRALDGPAPEDGVLTSEPRAEPVLPVPALMVEVDVTSAEAGPRC